MTNEIALIHCLFPGIFLLSGLAKDTRHCVPVLRCP
jgi:hypothetical protein